jgi:hypothetical protein
MAMEPLRPKRGGFLRSIGLGLFIRDYFLGRGPQGTPRIDSVVGTYQADIFNQYKTIPPIRLYKPIAITTKMRMDRSLVLYYADEPCYKGSQCVPPLDHLFPAFTIS